MFKKISLCLLVLAVFLLHQDCWNWEQTEPFVFGFLPVGLAYHAGYAILAMIMMALLVKFAWPAEFDRMKSEAHEEVKSSPKHER